MSFNFGSSASTNPAFSFGQSSAAAFGTPTAALGASGATFGTSTATFGTGLSGSPSFGQSSSSLPAFGSFGSSTAGFGTTSFAAPSSTPSSITSSGATFAFGSNLSSASSGNSLFGSGFGATTASAPAFANTSNAPSAFSAPSFSSTAGLGSSNAFGSAFGGMSAGTQAFGAFGASAGSFGSSSGVATGFASSSGPASGFGASSTAAISFPSPATSTPSFSFTQSTLQGPQASPFAAATSGSRDTLPATQSGQFLSSPAVFSSTPMVNFATSMGTTPQAASSSQSQGVFGSSSFSMPSSTKSGMPFGSAAPSSSPASSFLSTGGSDMPYQASAPASEKPAFAPVAEKATALFGTGSGFASSTSEAVTSGAVSSTGFFGSSSAPGIFGSSGPQSSDLKFANGQSSDVKPETAIVSAFTASSGTGNGTNSFAASLVKAENAVSQNASGSATNDGKPTSSAADSSSLVAGAFAMPLLQTPAGSASAGFSFSGGLTIPATESGIVGTGKSTGSAPSSSGDASGSLSAPSLPGVPAGSVAPNSSSNKSVSNSKLPTLALTPSTEPSVAATASFATPALQASQQISQSHAQTLSSSALAASTSGMVAAATAASSANVALQGNTGLTSSSIPSDIRNLNLDDILNKWSDEIDDLSSQFVSAAGLVSKWDRNIVANERAISDLWKETQCCSVAHTELSTNLDTILSQQQDLHQMLDALEREMEDVDRKQPVGSTSGAGSSLNADIEREAMHSLANEVMTDLDGMAVAIRDLVIELNKSSAVDSGDAVAQVIAVLNAHLDSLQYLDESSNQLRRRLADVSRACETVSRDPRNLSRRPGAQNL